MKRGTMKGFAIIAAVLMVVSLLPMAALADNGNGFENAPGQMKKNATGETVGVQDQDRLRTNYQEAKNIQAAKNDYNKMTSEFQMIKRQQARGNLTTEEMVNESKIYLNSTIDYMIIRLENIKDEGGYSDEVNDTIDDYISQFDDIKEDVGDAETRKDLSDALKDIRKLWKDAIKDIRQSTRERVGDGLETYLEKSDDVSESLQDEIDQVEDEEQAAELQELLDEYNRLIAEAKALLEEGNLEDAIDKTKEANEVLREILDEMKESRDGYVNMTGEGALNAEGDGTIVLSGQFNVTINATDAMLVIKDLAGDAEIDVSGATYDVVNQQTEDGYRASVYDNFTGDALINGTRLTVMVSGEDLTVFAEGTGSASLSGEGTYKVGAGDEMQFAEVEDDEEVTATTDSTEEETDEEDEEDDEIEIEIEVKIFEINSSATVEINDTVTEYIFDTIDEEEIKNEIVNETSLTYEEVNDTIKFEIEDFTSSSVTDAEEDDEETEEQED
ncbi:hypothetical protein J7W08_06915 [Methanococcoides orientis]|uniref:hypothetical protein n=1 Tax=Methanococcoides orientis TaxID=2822137 RepID=UPI001E43D85F|nr:hypothetical protein [Methanococcoides orientis]UGV39858.1 hypothetical protein J7W08_06915 [Methanococcoides orientis]